MSVERANAGMTTQQLEADLSVIMRAAELARAYDQPMVVGRCLNEIENEIITELGKRVKAGRIRA